MPSPAGSRSVRWILLVLAGLLATVLLVAACEEGQPSDGSAAASTTLPAAANDSTTVQAAETPVVTSSTTSTSAGSGITTTTGATESTTGGTTVTTTAASTTTAAPTSTTARPTTTTAKATTTTAKPTTTTTEETTTTKPKAPTVLTVSGPSGTKELSMADLKAMPASSGYGGWKNQLGNITAPTSWKGVSLRSLMELAGGGGSVTIVASDGYAATLSSGQAAGSVATYDPATGEPNSVSVKAIIAYAKGGGSLGSGEGPLRLAFISSEQNQVTDSDMWVKKVAQIEVD